MLICRRIDTDWGNYFREIEERREHIQHLGSIILNEIYLREELLVPYCPYRLPELGDRVVFQWDRAGLALKTTGCVTECDGARGLVTGLNVEGESGLSRGIQVKPDIPKSCAGAKPNPDYECPPYPEELDLIVIPNQYEPQELMRLLAESNEYNNKGDWKWKNGLGTPLQDYLKRRERMRFKHSSLNKKTLKDLGIV